MQHITTNDKVENENDDDDVATGTDMNCLVVGGWMLMMPVLLSLFGTSFYIV